MASDKKIKRLLSLMDKEKESHQEKRHMGIIDFNTRLLREVDKAIHAPDVPMDVGLHFMDIYVNNMTEYLSLKYPTLNTQQRKRISKEVASSCDAAGCTLERYIEIATGLNYDEWSNRFPKAVAIDNIDPSNIDYDGWYMLVIPDDSTAMEIYKSQAPHFNCAYPGQATNISEICYIKLIPNRSFPYISSEYDSDAEIAANLSEIDSINRLSTPIIALVNYIINGVTHISKYLDETLTSLFHHPVKTIQCQAEIFGYNYIAVVKDPCELTAWKVESYGREYNHTRSELWKRIFQNYFDNRSMLITTPEINYDTTILRMIEEECTAHKAKAIFITLYRVDPSSLLIRHLRKAADDGVDVFIYIEVMARGNEKENIKLVDELKKHKNIHIVCGYYGLKIHAKCFLSIRTNGSTMAHISTGNYDSRRWSVFKDYQFITVNSEICEEIYVFFKMILLKQPIISQLEYFTNPCRNVFISPIGLADRIIDEIRNSNDIFLQCNNLCDSAIIKELYMAEANISVLCRTSCALHDEPITRLKSGGTHSVSIRSNTGKYLDHGRLYCFHSNMDDISNDRIYISSADLLFRSLHKRIELMVKLPPNTILITQYGDGMPIQAYIDEIFRKANWKMEEGKFKPI